MNFFQTISLIESQLDITSTNNILLVDDQPENLLALESVLEQEGRNFITASNGVEGIELAQEHDISLILLDVQMPGKSGFEVAKILQSIDKTSKVPIIFITAISRELNYMLRGFEEGAVDYILKPVDANLIRAKVDVFLKLENQRREIESQNFALQNLGMMVEHSADMMATLNKKTLVFERVNPSFKRILGFDQDELRNMKVTSLLYSLEDLLDFEKLLYDSTEQNNKIIHFDCRVRCKDNSIKWISINVAQKFNQWFLNAQDVTHRKILEHEIERSNKDLEQYATLVSSEFKNNLNTIGELAQTLNEKYKGKLDDDLNALIEHLNESIPKTQAIMDSLLRYSTKGGVNKMFKHQNSTELVNAAISNLKPLIDKHGVNVTFDNLPTVWCDKTQMTILFENLFNTFLTAPQSASPEIQVSVFEWLSEWEFIIKSNVKSLDKKRLERIFTNIEQGDVNTNNTGDDGLNLCKTIVERHHGKIWVESVLKSEPVFHFTLKKKAD